MGERLTRLRNWLFWAAALVSAIIAIILAVVLLALLGALLWQVFPRLLDPGVSQDPGLGLATAGLALFTGLLFAAAAATALVAYREISTSTAVSSADLALQMDNRFHSDRVLHIRHGAATFLAQHHRDSNRELKREVHLRCYHKISPYVATQELWCGLTSDLVDIFNYFDWIGYLADPKTKAIDEKVAAQKFGPWIINYYQICEEELGIVWSNYPARWRYLKSLYQKLIEREQDQHEKVKPHEPYNGKRTKEEIADFLRREHVRSHRGSTPGSLAPPTHLTPS